MAIKLYRGIQAYSCYMGSYQYWTREQNAKATALNAPDDTYAVDGEKISRLSELEINSPLWTYLKAQEPEIFQDFCKKV